MRIGNIEIASKAALAPMAGVTDMPFRLICHEMGSAFAVSEMLSAKGCLYAPDGYVKNEEILARDDREGITGLQLFGHDPVIMADAAQKLRSRGFAFIDINMGCPAKKIVSNGDGSALMLNIRLAGEIVRKVSSSVDIPVTVKFRSGWDAENVNCVDFARAMEDAGARAITLHARTRDQFYSGRADWKQIALVKKAVSIPVIGNGDITDAGSLRAMLDSTGCDMAAIGRAAMGNPWIFRQTAAEGKEFRPPDISEVAKTARRHMEMEIALRGEKSAVLEMRKHIAWYIRGFRGAAALRRRMNSMVSAHDILSVLQEAREICDSAPAGREGD